MAMKLPEMLTQKVGIDGVKISLIVLIVVLIVVYLLFLRKK
jgi:hypothetical protein